MALLACFTASVLIAEDKKVAGAKEASEKPVFPADADGEAAKRELLSSIVDVTSGDKRPPNIVLLFSDDLGYGDISLYGSKKIPTPNIDALGKQGVRFSNAYVTAASWAVLISLLLPLV